MKETAYKVTNTKENEEARQDFLEFAEESNISVIPTEDGTATIYITNENSIPAGVLKRALSNYELKATKLFTRTR